MSKRKEKFDFYPNDFAGGTVGFNRFVKGCYIDLLILQYNSRGKFTEEEARNYLGDDFEKCWQKLKLKFQTDNIFFWNIRLRKEMEKRQRYLDSRAENLIPDMVSQTTDNNIKSGDEVNNKITKQKLKLKSLLEPYLQKYGKEFLNEFYSFWTELNLSKTNCRYMLQDTFEVGKRLAYWKRRRKEKAPLPFKSFSQEDAKVKPELPESLRKVAEKIAYDKSLNR